MTEESQWPREVFGGITNAPKQEYLEFIIWLSGVEELKLIWVKSIFSFHMTYSFQNLICLPDNCESD